MQNREHLKKHLKAEEGLKLQAYPEKISGLWHIGYGHLLQGQDQTDAELDIMGLEEEPNTWEGFTITHAQADALLEQDIQDAVASLAPTWSENDLQALNPNRFIALIAMAFQIGGYGVQRKFPAFVQAVQNADWNRAADEMLWRNGLKKQKRSAWYTQTPTRCQTMATAMRTGTGLIESRESTQEGTYISEETPTQALFESLETTLAVLKSRIDR